MSNYWDKRYASGRSSGDGSYGLLLDRKINWLSGLDIKSIADVGCGDFNFGKNLLQIYPTATYTGLDTSSFIIHKNRVLYPYFDFKEYTGEIPKSDLVLCIDVLLHVLDDNELESLLSNLEKSWTKYLAITAYERDGENSLHMRVKKFNYKRFGEPIIREICEEEGSHYFYLWKK